LLSLQKTSVADALLSLPKHVLKKVKIEHVYNTIVHILSARRNKNRRYKEKDTQTALLVRLIRAEAEGDGE